MNGFREENGDEDSVVYHIPQEDDHERLQIDCNSDSNNDAHAQSRTIGEKLLDDHQLISGERDANLEGNRLNGEGDENIHLQELVPSRANLHEQSIEMLPVHDPLQQLADDSSTQLDRPQAQCGNDEEGNGMYASNVTCAESIPPTFSGTVSVDVYAKDVYCMELPPSTSHNEANGTPLEVNVEHSGSGSLDSIYPYSRAYDHLTNTEGEALSFS